MRQAAHIPTNAAGAVGTRIEMSSVYCVGCHWPASLDDAHLCPLCRVVPRNARKASNAARISAVWLIMGLAAAVVFAGVMITEAMQ